MRRGRFFSAVKIGIVSYMSRTMQSVGILGTEVPSFPALGITRYKIAADSMQSWLSLFDCVLAALAVALPRICVVPWLGLVGHPQSKGLRLCASYVADTNCVNMKGDHAPKPRLHLIDSDIV